MDFNGIVLLVSDYVLFGVCIFLLLGSVLISFKMRFVQLRLLSDLFSRLKLSLNTKKNPAEHHTILPHKALFTAMSTTLGIGTIVAPVIAINLGGPGALLGFLLTAFFGSAATYIEVNLSLQHRKKLNCGTIMGGPMQYLSCLLSPKVAKFYAISCLLLMMAWSGMQANQLTAILDSPLLGDYRVPTFISGAVLSGAVLLVLAGGIQRLGSFSAKLVPLMFLLYVGSSLLILGLNIDKLPGVFTEIFKAAFTPYAMASGALVGGVVSALRWGIFKGIQTTEAGVGTQTIPHSMADTADPQAQATLAMFSTYSAGFVALLSGCVTLVTGTWQDSSLPLGISMVAASFQSYFSLFGIVLIVISAFLFAFGTILGNSYNGSHCFSYMTNHRGVWYYFIASALIIFIGAIGEVTVVWSLCDLVLACVAVPHMTALIMHAYQKPAVVPSDLIADNT